MFQSGIHHTAQTSGVHTPHPHFHPGETSRVSLSLDLSVDVCIYLSIYPCLSISLFSASLWQLKTKGEAALRAQPCLISEKVHQQASEEKTQESYAC